MSDSGDPKQDKDRELRAQREFYEQDPTPPSSTPMSDEQSDELIKRMVDRFLGWRLPDDFQPDAGISFKPTYTGYQGKEMKHDPTGTNLFTATQAEAMIRYILSDDIAHHTKEAVEAALQKTDLLCFDCGNPYYRFEGRLQCLAAGCGSYELSAPQQSTSPDRSAE